MTKKHSNSEVKKTTKEKTKQQTILSNLKRRRTVLSRTLWEGVSFLQPKNRRKKEVKTQRPKTQQSS